MKDYKDIANSVFRRREEYEKERSRKKAVFIRRTSIALSCCIMLTVCFGIWRMDLLKSFFSPGSNEQFNLTEPPTAAHTEISVTTVSSTSSAQASTALTSSTAPVTSVTSASATAAGTSSATSFNAANITSSGLRTTAPHTALTQLTASSALTSGVTASTTPDAVATHTGSPKTTTTRHTDRSTTARTTNRTTTTPAYTRTTARTTSVRVTSSTRAFPTTTTAAWTTKHTTNTFWATTHTTTTTRTTSTGYYTTTAVFSQPPDVSSTAPPQTETLTGFRYRGSLYRISDRYDTRPYSPGDPVLYSGNMRLNGDDISYSVYYFDGITEEFICSVSTEPGTQRYICVNTQFIPENTRRCLNSTGVCDYMELTDMYSAEKQSYRSASESERDELIGLLKELDGSLTSYSRSDNYLRQQAADTGGTYPDTDLSQYSVAFKFEMPEIIDPSKYFGSGYIAFTDSGEMIFELLNYKYTFDVGEEAAGKIISSFS